MDQPVAYPITYGVLGMLAHWGPLTGYDLKRLFSHMPPPLWGVSQSQIYKELRRLKSLDLVDVEHKEQELRPDRKVYSITRQGYTALYRWQAEPPLVFQMRDELLFKVLFGSFASFEDLTRNLLQSIGEHEERLHVYRENDTLQSFGDAQPQGNAKTDSFINIKKADPYFALIFRFAIKFEQMYLDWLYEALKEVESLHQRGIEDNTSLPGNFPHSHAQSSPYFRTHK